MSKKIESGFAYDPELNAVYHFGHVAIEKADTLAGQENPAFVVETINWTFAEGDKKTVHLNQYFTKSLSDAIFLTQKLRPLLQEVAETIFSVRMATEEEAKRFKLAARHFQSQMPEAIPDSDIPE